MLFELLEAFQVGKEAGNVIENLYNGDHYDVVNKAYEMAQSLDVNDHYNEGVREILDQLSVVDNNDRDFVKAAAYELRARCYFDLGDYAKARQNITACLNIQIDSFTLEKDCIREHQKSVRELRTEIDKACSPTPQLYPANSNDRKRKERKERGQNQQKHQQIMSSPMPPLSPIRRQEILAAIADCEGANPGTKNEGSIICTEPAILKQKFKQFYNIEISSSKLGSVNTYAGMIDIVAKAAPLIKPRQQIMEALKEQQYSPQLKDSQADYYSLPFSMPVEDVFEIEGRGTVITGRIATGHIKVGDVILVSKDEIVLVATVVGCEMFRKLINQAEFGDNVGLLVSGVNSTQVTSGMMATAFAPKVVMREVARLASRGDYQDAMAIMKDTAHLEDCRHFYLMMAKQYLREGQFQNAIGSLCEAEKKFPPDDNRAQAIIHFDRGRALYGLKLYDEARDNFRKCLSFSPICRYEDKQLGISGQLSDLAQSELDKIDNILSSNIGKKRSSGISDDEQEYLDEVKECLADGEIGPRERRLLDKLASKLGISPERAVELEASLSAPELTDGEKEYLEEVKAVLADGEISEKERRLLEKLRKMLDISEERAKELESMK